MSFGQSPFSTQFQNNTTPLITIGSEETADENDLVPFIKGTSGNGKKLYVDTSLKYNPNTKLFTIGKISSKDVLFTDTNGTTNLINIDVKCIGGSLTFTPSANFTPYAAGSVSIGGLGTLSLSGASSSIGIGDRTTGDTVRGRSGRRAGAVRDSNPSSQWRGLRPL